jgi:biopolymer transport protein ExbB
MTILYSQILLQVEAAGQIEILDLLQKGGLVMIPLGLLSLIALIIIIERILFFGKNLRISESTFQSLTKLLRDGNLNEAASLCNKQNNCFGRIFIYAASGSQDQGETDKLLEDAANVEISRLERSLNYLTIIAGVAPLLGFIGTIAGVITIFHSISESNDISISTISGGLYKKMVSSATGLVIGIIAFAAYHLFINQVDGFAVKIQDWALKLRVALKERTRA